MINKIILVGNVGKDPEIRSTQSGSEIASFSLATSESYKDKNGEKQTITQWHNVSVFGKTVNIIKSYVKKGSKLYLEGSIKYDEYEKDGEKRYSTKIVINNFSHKVTLLGENPQKKEADYSLKDTAVFDDNIPF